MVRRVEVVPQNSGWIALFQAESIHISGLLEDIAIRIHHFGSTSIPTIHAKPIIDILLEVDSLSRLDQKVEAMRSLGYQDMGEFGIPGRRYYRKNNSSGIRTHHVHAFESNNPEIDRHLAFRDYMIAHPVEAQMYCELKQHLAQKYPEDIEAYMDGKDPFIKEHEVKALQWWSTR